MIMEQITGYPIRVRGTALIIQDDAVLLIEYDDENGLHYNLPGGGIEAGESIIAGLQREVQEEAAADIEVGRLVFVYEYAPQRDGFRFGPVHKLNLVFVCELTAGAVPRLPARPDPNQTDVKWVALSELESITLYPMITSYILAYARDPAGRPVTFIEECSLAQATGRV
jgi:8-oxo-dGTP diphosphatase